MRRLNAMSFEDIIAYNLRDNGTAVTVFEDAQTERVHKARQIIDGLLAHCPPRARIIEPGCSAGDISGPYAKEHDVWGIDVVPTAIELSRSRYPDMRLTLAAADELEPEECDILVLCEFLEHIVEPVEFVTRWLPKASFVVIGHPLVGDGYDPEPGHLWAYTGLDYENWFAIGGHTRGDAWTFPMGPYTMVIGSGRRA